MTPNASDAGEQRARRRPPAARASRRGGGRGARRLRLGRRGQVERGVLGEDRLVQALQLGAGLDADLLDERRARVAVGGERLRLAAGAIEREHPLGVQALAQRVLGDERVELADHLGVPAGREVGVDRHLGRAQAQLLEPADLGRGERLVGEVGERLAAPQRERLARRATRSSSRSKRTASTSPLGELQLVAAAAGHDSNAVAVERAPQVRHVELHHLRARSAAARRPTAPPPAGRPTPSGPAPARASRAPPAACGGPARRARPRGEPRAALAAAHPPWRDPNAGRSAE